MASPISLQKLRQALSLGEDDDWEFKDGRGSVGKGGVGKAFAETVSAFANTDGGVIVCGIESQDNDTMHIARGFNDPRAYKEKIWDALRNRDVISRQCCLKGDVEAVPFDGVTLVIVRVPPAPRQYRPVHIGKTAYNKNSFKRFESKDCACDDDEVDGMKRDARGAAQDSAIIEGTSTIDLDAATLLAFRNRVASHKPTSALLAMTDKAMLKSIGAWRDQPKPKLEGLTLAGVLMFGKQQTITDALPNFSLNYADRSGGNERHDHRITSDDDDWGSPNLFNFFFEVYPHLVKGLQVPFALSAEAMRDGETPFHRAVREALLNALVHADFHQRGTIRIVKKADSFLFENPGRSLTPLSRIKAARGEHKNLTDIRNPAIAGMFARLGFVEKEGYGFPAIYNAWDQGKRHEPTFLEDPERKVVSATLPLLSQISPEIEAALQRAIGSEYSTLSALDKDILVYAKQFGEVTTDAIRSIRREHATEISGRLRVMAGKGWLKKVDATNRAPTYVLASGAPLVWGQGRFGEGTWGGDLFTPTPPIPPSLPPEGGGIEVVTVGQVTEKRILDLCSGKYLTTKEIAEALSRTAKQIQGKYIARLVKERKLIRKHPDTPSAKGQSYKTTGT